MKPLVLTLALAQFVAGCAPTDFLAQAIATGGEVSRATQRQFGRAIDGYCASVPAPIRLGLRDRVNSYATRGEIKITCTDLP